MRILQIEPAASSDFLVTISQASTASESGTEISAGVLLGAAPTDIVPQTVLDNIYFSTFSGIEKVATRPKYTDGLSNTKRTAQTGALEVSDVTISKPFDPEVDPGFIAWVDKNFSSGDYFQMKVLPVKRTDKIVQRGTKAFELVNCRIMKASYPGSVDTGNADAVAMVSITASVSKAYFK